MQAFCGYVYGDSCAGQAALYRVDINGIPVFNVNNNCASGSSAFALATQAVESGNVECALALGFEEMLAGAIDMIFPDKVSPLTRHEDAIMGIMDFTEEERKPPPAIAMFGAQVDAMLASGVTEETIAAMSVKSSILTVTSLPGRNAIRSRYVTYPVTLARFGSSDALVCTAKPPASNTIDKNI